jgi:phosphate-selective porin
MLERGLTVDDIIVLRDESENGDFLIKRWYFLYKKEIDQKIWDRKAFELEEKKRKEEEEMFVNVKLSQFKPLTFNLD